MAFLAQSWTKWSLMVSGITQTGIVILLTVLFYTLKMKYVLLVFFRVNSQQTSKNSRFVHPFMQICLGLLLICYLSLLYIIVDIYTCFLFA